MAAAALPPVSLHPRSGARAQLGLFAVFAVPLVLTLGAVAGAQEPARDAYFGMGLGRLAYKISSSGSSFLDTSVGAMQFYGGFRLSRHWGFEGSYIISDTATQQGLPTSVRRALAGTGLPLDLDATTTVRLEIATIRLLRRFPRDWGQLFAGIGASGASVDTELRLAGGTPLAAGFHTAKNGLTFNAGTQWEFPSWSVRLQYEWWDADMQAAGLSFHWNL